MPLNWGILGAGYIADAFARDLLLSVKDNSKTHAIASIGSSLVEKAERFIESVGITADANLGVSPKAQNYDDFFANPDVEVVYIATPHTFHKDQVLRALKSGKHVLCEKPFTVTAKEAREIFEVAKGTGLFVMEAVWTRFIPLIAEARKLLYQDKVLGQVYRLWADYFMDIISDLPLLSRARDISLAAGATLDIGIYPLTHSRLLLDESGSTKFDVKSFLTLDPADGVDHLSTYIVKYADGKQGVLSATNRTEKPGPFLRVEAELGWMEMYAANPAVPHTLRVVFNDSSKQPIEVKEKSAQQGYKGFIHEANAAAETIAAGKQQCAQMSWDETLLMMDTMDKIRWENGLFYEIAGEKK